MKKLLMFFLAFLLCGVLAGCGKTKVEKSLYEQGLELISLMKEMVENEAYSSMYTGNDEMLEMILNIGKGDYSKEKSVYRIAIDEEEFQSMPETSIMFEGMSERVKEYVIARAYAGIPSRINSTVSSNALAIASICNAGKSFVSDEIDGNSIYLYIYENAMPVMVTFIEGEDGAVSASGYFIFNEEFSNDNIDEMKQLLYEGPISIEKIEK